MKKNCFLFIVLTCFKFQAQTITFAKNIFYPTHNGIMAMYEAINQTTDKGYVTCRGIVDSTGGQNNIYGEIIKTDSAGHVQWIKRAYAGKFTNNITSQTGINVIQTSDKGYTACVPIYQTYRSTQIILIKLDSAGNLLWSKKYTGAGSATAYGIKQTKDQGYVLCGATTDTSAHIQYAYIFKTDSMGNYDWGNKCLLGNDTIGAFTSVVENLGVGFTAVGYSNSHSLVANFNLNGSLVWDKYFFNNSSHFFVASSFFSITKTSDKHFVISGFYYDTVTTRDCINFLKLDTLGNQVWFKGAIPTNPVNYYNSFGGQVKAINNQVAFAVYVQDPIPATVIGKLDLNGNIIWSNEFDNTFHTFASNTIPVSPTADKGFITAEFVGIYRNNMAEFGYELLKLDSLGHVGCDGAPHTIPLANLNQTAGSNCISIPVGSAASYTLLVSNAIYSDTVWCITPTILNINTYIEVLKETKIYPNPSTNIFNISAKVNIDEVIVTNITGQTINKIMPKVTDVQLQILQAGIYFVTIRIGQEKITKKIVVQN